MPIYKTSDVKKHNVTVVGSPTVVNGVASGFSSANYLTLPKTFSPQNSTWEIVSEFTTSDDIATDQGVLGGLGASNGCTPFYVLSNNWIIFLSSDGSSWDIAKGVIVMPLSVNTKYRCKVEFTGNEYICSSYNFTNDEWEVKKTITSTSVIYGGLTQQIGTNRGNNSPFLGSIDLNESYININGSRWWSGMDYAAEKIKDICIAGQNTNCITHIPQDIKLELKNGVITLKAGSKVYVPNGFEADGVTPKFDVVVIESDIIFNYNGTGSSDVFLLYNTTSSTLTYVQVVNSTSGTTAPTGTGNFYNTANNTIKYYNNGTPSDYVYAFPLAIMSRSGNTITGIKQIFNGFGYIGSTIFALPGVKGLIPDGRNEDGTLKAIEWTNEKILLTSRNTSGDNKPLIIGITRPITIGSQPYTESAVPLADTGSGYSIYLNTAENILYVNNGTTWVTSKNILVATLNMTTGGVISSLSPKSVESPLKPVHIDKVYKGSTLVYQGAYTPNQVVFEKATAGTYSVNLEKAGLYEITVVGGGGAAAMRGVYDDKGYGWGGGSGGAFVGTFVLERGTRTVVVGKANNNTTAQSGNTQTLNPTDTKTYGSSVSGVVSVGGGGSGHYSTSYVGAAGAAATLTITPTSTTLNKAGNAGSSGSGGKGSAAAATVNGGASVYNGYGKGQGCKTSEYASKRSWINGTAGYVKIVYKGSRS